MINSGVSFPFGKKKSANMKKEEILMLIENVGLSFRKAVQRGDGSINSLDVL